MNVVFTARRCSWRTTHITHKVAGQELTTLCGLKGGAITISHQLSDLQECPNATEANCKRCLKSSKRVNT